MDIKDAKLMGGIGSILALLSFIPKAGWIISLVGFILVIIAIKKLTDATNRDDVFNDYLKGAIINIVGSIIIAFVGGAFVIMAIMRRHAGVPNFGAIVIFLLIASIVMIIGTYFMKKGLFGLSEATGEKNFATAGNLLFWGAILLIIVIGGIVSLIGYIFQIIAFFSLPDTI